MCLDWEKLMVKISEIFCKRKKFRLKTTYLIPINRKKRNIPLTYDDNDQYAESKPV